MIKGFKGVSFKRKLEILSENIDKYSKSSFIKNIASRLRGPGHVIGWVNERVDYRLEDEETLYTPQETLERGRGDCDDLTLLVGALLKAKGFPVAVRIITNGTNHVFPLVLIHNKWSDADPSPRGMSVEEMNRKYHISVQGMVGPGGKLRGLPARQSRSSRRSLGQAQEDDNDSDTWYSGFMQDVMKNIPAGLGLGLGTVLSNYLWSSYLKGKVKSIF